jgi:ADP-glucose pyrophosphorylase
MGGDVIPAFVERGEAYVYDLNRNVVPGARSNDRFYWRDVGTIDAFYDAHQDLISKDPVFNFSTTTGQSFPNSGTLPRRNLSRTRTETLVPSLSPQCRWDAMWSVPASREAC